jgi:demethylmenaquinone methyltransferase / 2-methoxy-6-polyprenyl-1,4-benzoquinol methylase
LVREPSYLRDLFGRNARSYDPVNRIISLWQVDRWRRGLVRAARPTAGERVLDAFSGPGSLSVHAAPRLGPCGEVVLADLSPTMLHQARERLRDRLGRTGQSAGSAPRLRFVAADLFMAAPSLGAFDLVLLGFAVRYAPSKSELLSVARDLLRPGGRVAILEFGSPGGQAGASTITGLPARLFFHRLLPAIAGRLGPGREVYDYLTRSTAESLSASGLAALVREAGFNVRSCDTRLGGLVILLVAVRQ